MFTELTEMLEERHSFDLVDRVQLRAGLDGVWTAVGTYPDDAFYRYVVAACKETEEPPERLIHAFGAHMANRFLRRFPDVFADVTEGFDVFERLESRVHPELAKLWPDARMPRFSPTRTPDGLEVHYVSERIPPSFALGLVDAMFLAFGPPVVVTSVAAPPNGTLFHIRRAA